MGEYGIFGGKAGGHVLDLLLNLRMPIVARRYVACFEQARAAHGERRRAGLAAKTLAKDSDTINMYYGGADSCIALATGSVRGCLRWLDERGKLPSKSVMSWPSVPE